MLEQVSTSVKFVAFYTASKTGKTGLTVTVDLYDPSGTQIVTGGSATAIGGGLYAYTLSTNNSAEGEYAAIFKTSDTTVDSQHIPSLWVLGRAGVENLDATVSSRLAPNGTLATVTNLTNAPASVTPSDIWSHATRTITGGTVDTLTNAPSVPSAASIRAEIDSNSTQLSAIKSKTDNLPASPAATGDIPSANITAIKAKTDLLNTDRLAQCSTVATTGAQLAAALS